MTPIQVSGLKKNYGSRVALRGIDFEVSAGDVFGFIGPNGAGKSTTIKILCGLVFPTAGSARIQGHPCGSREARRGMAYLPELPAWPESLTLRELLEIHARLAGISDRRRCSDALEQVGLGPRANSRVRELSKGMLQRFGLAQALLAEPSLLVLDEPASGLDPVAQKDLKDVLADLRARGVTVFFSSHVLTDVERMCDRIAILHGGKLLACAPMRDMLQPTDDLAVRFRGGDFLRARLEKMAAVRSDGADWVVDVGRAAVNEAVDAIRAEHGDLLEVTPRRRSLEEAYFGLLAGAEAVA